MKPERIVAGAPVKHAPIVLESTQIAQGTWRERRSDGSVWTVCDLTSPLWRATPTESKNRKRSPW